MSKALTGATELIGAVGMGVAAFVNPALLASPLFDKVWASLIIGGISSEAGALADALSANRGAQITVRQPAANAGILYGQGRIGGVLVYASTTGSKHDQMNRMIAYACHPIDAYQNLYIDGRQVFWSGNGVAHSGIMCSGDADGNDHYDASNTRYNFGGLVFFSNHIGDDGPGYFDPALNANDPTWGPSANGTPYGGPDLSYAYLKIEYDSAMFPQEPEIRCTIRGKNNIWDPRDNTYKYTINWALIVADVLMNPEWGLGFPQSAINTDQLISATNLCDELVPLANGTQERRYTFNGSFDTSASPGDILNQILGAAGGNVNFAGGQWYIYPAAAYAVSFNWTEADLVSGITGSAYRSNAEISNRVVGVFTAPDYPYSPTGDLYDANGFDPDGFRQGNYNLAWQKTSYPTYYQGPDRGYPTDQWLNADNGVEKYMTLDLPGVISLATAQRLAKIALLRQRLQPGKYQFRMHLRAFRMQVMDVFGMTFAQLGWNNKLLQVTDIQFVCDYDNDAPALYVQVSAQDYDPNVYAWQIQEELTILDSQAAPRGNQYTVEEPTEITVVSGPSTAIVNTDGVVTPRVLVTWVDPPDVSVTLVETQWSISGANSWVGVGTTPVGNGLMYFAGPTAGQVIDVRVRSLRGSGASSGWLQATGDTVSATTVSQITSIGLGVGIPYDTSNDCAIVPAATPTSCSIEVYGPGGAGTAWDLVRGSGTISVPPATIAGAAYNTEYYVTCSFDLNGFPDYNLYTVFNASVKDTEAYLGYCLTPAQPTTGTTTGTPGGGGTGGGGASGPRACAEEGTPLDTPDGPVSNVILKARFDAGEDVYLSGRDVPERIVRAEWVDVKEIEHLTVGNVQFGCSYYHTLSVEGRHTHCGEVPSGSLVETRTGYKPVQRITTSRRSRVLRIELSGPSHEYSVGGVLSHNASVKSATASQ